MDSTRYEIGAFPASSRWRSSTRALGLYQVIDRNLCRYVESFPKAFPRLHQASNLVIASDYSGEHQDSQYLVISVLIADLDSVTGSWDRRRKQVRQDYMPDSRRMSFKALRDNARRRALVPFLTASSVIRGLSFTMAIHRSVGTFFAGEAPLDLSNPDFHEFQSWKPAVLEKACRVVHLIAFLLSGLSRSGQNVFWFTDEDAIASNDLRIGQLTKLFGWISSEYLEHSLGHLRCGTTKSDDGSLLIEDTAAIPDLIAGAAYEQFQVSAKEECRIIRDSFWITSGGLSSKTSNINWWFVDSKRPLKKMLCRVDPSEDSHGPMVLADRPRWSHACVHWLGADAVERSTKRPSTWSTTSITCATSNCARLPCPSVRESWRAQSVASST